MVPPDVGAVSDRDRNQNIGAGLCEPGPVRTKPAAQRPALIEKCGRFAALTHLFVLQALMMTASFAHRFITDLAGRVGDRIGGPG